MSRVLLTVSAVIRTPCRTGLPPPPVLPLPPSRDPRLAPFAPAGCVAPKPGVPPVPLPPMERDPKPFDDEPKPLDDEPLLLPFRDRRSVLDDAEAPDPGASWLLAASSEAEEDPPMHMSVST